MTAVSEAAYAAPQVVATAFASKVIAWQKTHGRNSLPWQNTHDPYRVWLSEIMLQQTQVSSVLVYFSRFLARFPDVQSLAAASLDDVLALWSGLGYYSRARNLYRCAQQVMEVHGGRFPPTAALLQTLPGIGRSTAAAIASFCYGERAAILDANVKRVLTRVLGFGADLALAANERALWDQATALLPALAGLDTMPRYTQGLMDLGATVCVPRQPACLLCPVQPVCRAQREGAPEKYPVKTRKLKRSTESWWLLWAQDPAGRVWLQRRPGAGVWAGLYCLPVFDSREALAASVGTAVLEDLPVFLHVLTHKDLYLHPVQIQWPQAARPGVHGDWIEARRWVDMGLPAPIRKLLSAI
ncbi:MAG: A/G-specific adenine glycosylase [Ferruginibacter sp.]|nr:A/G-specific adenine glycosylase [Rhodoferax sp.]